jgi:hypothetical protein
VKKLFLTLVLLAVFGVAWAVAADKPAEKPADKTAAPATTAAMEPDHGLVTPDNLKWGPAPPVFQAGSQMAVLSGNPMAAGPYVVRLKMPDGYKIMPHWHPTTENVTVISGMFHLGAGEKFDATKGMDMPAGSYGFVGPHMNHYAWATGETVVQVHGMGPFQLTYVNPADDPSKAATK